MQLSCRRAQRFVTALAIGIGVLFVPRPSFAQG